MCMAIVAAGRHLKKMSFRLVSPLSQTEKPPSEAMNASRSKNQALQLGLFYVLSDNKKP